MKYLIPIALLLALCGCERNSPEPQDGTEGVALPESVATEQVASGKAPAYLDKPLTGKVSQRGLYRLVRSGGVIDDPNTGTGKAVSKPVVQLVRSTERIPLIKGVQMYLQYRIWPLPDQPAWVDLRRVLKHPEMTLPDGSVSTGSDYMIKGRVSVNQVIAYTGYGLDEDYELVEGDWVFEIWYQDKKLIEQKFTTYRPDKEEIAALKPLLTLGNKVLTQVESPGKPGSRPSWPRMVVGKDEIDANPGLSDLKRSLDDPLNQP
ncbi:MAG: DUF3859 domain-containing protein [Pseudomonadota bacterium]